jgi:hypothetical protein
MGILSGLLAQLLLQAVDATAQFIQFLLAG